MKRIFTLMLCLLLLISAFAIVSCNKDDDDDDGDKGETHFTLAVAKENLQSHGYTANIAPQDELAQLEGNFAAFDVTLTLKGALEAEKEATNSFVDVYELESAQAAKDAESAVKASALGSMVSLQVKDNYLIMGTSADAIQHALNKKGGSTGGSGGSGMCTVTFSPENGDATFTQTVAVGEKLTRPTNPEKDGYMFTGWYNDGKLWSFSKAVEGNMTLVAGWVYNKVVIEYDPGQGMLQDDEWEIEVQKNARFHDHPTPTHSNAGMMFEGWYFDREYTEPVSSSYIFTENIVLYARWIMQTQCVDGSYNHSYGAYYTFEDATCTSAAVVARDCVMCGSSIRMSDSSVGALGHDWSEKVEAGFGFARRCQRVGCNEKQFYDFNDITSEALGNNPAEQVELTEGSGTLFGEERVPCIVNGIWDESNSAVFCGKGSKIVITITLATPSQMDRIYVKGRGNATFNILVQYSGDSEFVRVGSGAFLSDTENAKDESERAIPFGVVDRTKLVKKVQIIMPTPSNGSDYWEEIGFFMLDGDIADIQDPSDEIVGNDPVNGKVTVNYDPGRGMLADGEWDVTVEVGSRIPTHPIPTHYDESMLFDGWYFDKACTKPALGSFVYERGYTLYAKWIQQAQCVDGTYNHQWGGYYVFEDATCDAAGILAKDCTLCGSSMKVEDASAPALGHDLGAAVEQGFGTVQSCTRPECDYKVVVEYTNVTDEALGNSPADCVKLTEGSAWGEITCIVDGRWDNGSTIAGKGDKMVVDITFENATVIDRIYLKGRGAEAEFKLYVQYEGENDFTYVGEGKFLTDTENSSPDRKIPYAEVNGTKKVTKVQIIMPTPSVGSDQWEEIGFFRLPDEE